MLALGEAMEQQIEHRHIPIRGLNLHVAHAGKGEQRLVVFLLELVLAQRGTV